MTLLMAPVLTLRLTLNLTLASMMAPPMKTLELATFSTPMLSLKLLGLTQRKALNPDQALTLALAVRNGLAQVPGLARGVDSDIPAAKTQPREVLAPLAQILARVQALALS